MDTTWVERKADGEAQKHMWNFARTIQKKVVFASYGDKKWIYFENPKRKKSWVHQAHLHINRKTESFWQEDDAPCLVGPEGCGLLWAAKAWWND